MSTVDLKSRLWSCATLEEALAALDVTAEMPSNPEDLKDLVEDPTKVIVGNDFLLKRYLVCECLNQFVGSLKVFLRHLFLNRLSGAQTHGQGHEE